MEELLIPALIIGGGSSDGNFTGKVGGADGSAVVALALAAGGGVAASAVAALAIAAGCGVTAAGWSVVVALAVAAGEGAVAAGLAACLAAACLAAAFLFDLSDITLGRPID